MNTMARAPAGSPQPGEVGLELHAWGWVLCQLVGDGAPPFFKERQKKPGHAGRSTPTARVAPEGIPRRVGTESTPIAVTISISI